MSNQFVPIKTAELVWRQDLLFSVEYDDIYFSAAGGVDQSQYVFIEGNNLIRRWSELPTSKPSHFNIAETGFGTGLNFLVAWALWEQHAPESANLHFISCELHPLKSDDLCKALSFFPQFKKNAQLLIDNYPVLTPGFHHLSFCDGRVRLTLMLGNAQDCFEQLLICGESKLESKLRSSFIDAWFLDGFTPRNNPEMWTESLVSVISMLSRDGTSLATYTAAQPVKSILGKFGFIVEKKKGFGPKRHMITACFNASSDHRQKTRHTPWHISIPSKHLDKKVVIIGAGLAGCFTAYSLASRGWKVTLMESSETVGNGASGNQQAVLFPKLSAYKSPLTQFMLSSFLYANQFYKNLLKQFRIGELKGSLILAHNEKERLAQHNLLDWLSDYPDLGRLVDAQMASNVTGISIDESGLFIPLSGWMNSPALCQILANTPGITLLTNQHIHQLIQLKDSWIINNVESQVVILANGNQLNLFEQTKHLPVKSIRGQMTTIDSTNESSFLKIPLCGEGHVLPIYKGHHSLGATYELGVVDAYTSNHDDLININKIQKMTPNMIWPNQSVGHWAGIRASTPDYLPLVGQIAQADAFISLYSGLESNSKRWIPHTGPYYPGLYSCAGFGSRGLTTIPLSAEWLASSINKELSCLPRNLIQAISPARFLRRNITRGIY